MSDWLDGPLLFLDIDGVLNSVEYLQRGGSLSCVTDGIDPRAVAQLQRIVDATDCSLILSSSWRTMYTLAEMRQKLVDKGIRYPCPLRDKTPDFSFDGPRRLEDPRLRSIEANLSRYQRGREVSAWIAEHRFSGRYVCVDDDADFLPIQPLVRTSFQQGLTVERADRCIDILKG